MPSGPLQELEGTDAEPDAVLTADAETWRRIASGHVPQLERPRETHVPCLSS